MYTCNANTALVYILTSCEYVTGLLLRTALHAPTCTLTVDCAFGGFPLHFLFGCKDVLCRLIFVRSSPRGALQMRALLAVLTTAVLHVDLAVRSAAGYCLTHFLKGYACDELLECCSTYCHLLEDGITNRRIGGAVALGALPRALAAPCMESIVPRLCGAIHANTAKDRGDVDARVAAIQVCTLLF